MLGVMMYSTQSDELAACIRSHHTPLVAVARRVLRDTASAQDAVQDAMVSAIRNLQRFRGESRLSTWVRRIVINAAISRRRAIRARPAESLNTLLDNRELPDRRGRPLRHLAASAPSPERTLVNRELRSVVRGAIDRLPDDYRMLVVKRHLEDVDLGEIAATLGITPNAAKLRLLRARRMLRDLLAERGLASSLHDDRRRDRGERGDGRDRGERRDGRDRREEAR